MSTLTGATFVDKIKLARLAKLAKLAMGRGDGEFEANKNLLLSRFLLALNIGSKG